MKASGEVHIFAHQLAKQTFTAHCTQKNVERTSDSFLDAAPSVNNIKHETSFMDFFTSYIYCSDNFNKGVKCKQEKVETLQLQ